MIRRSKYLVCCLFLFLIIGKNTQAADELGAEIRYECVDQVNRIFQIEVTRYYACSAVIPSTAPVISITGSCALPVPSGVWQASTVVDVTPLCPSIATTCTTLVSPILDGVHALKYTREYDFSAATCNDYKISFHSCCRPANTTSGAAGESLYVEVGPLDPFLCNHAPLFLFQPVIILDTATEAFVALGAYDEEGDSLAYELVSCLDTAGTANTYLAGYSAKQPLGSAWNVILDSLTGNLNFIPTPGASVKAPLCLEIREYRNGSLISTYRRDIQVEAVNNIPAQPSANLPTLLLPNADSVWGGNWISDRIVTASIGEPIIFELDVFDKENDSTYVTWTENIPGLDFRKDNDPTGPVNTVVDRNPTVEITYIPKGKGKKFFGVRLTDRKWCGLVNIRDYIIGIDVQDTSFFATFNTDTLFICWADTLTLQPTIIGRPATTPLAHTWSNASNDSTLKVFAPGIYEVEVRDTLGIDELNRYAKTSVVVAYAPDCVWPGDADNDGVANNFDALAIGLAYGLTGPVRNDQGIDWSGKQATAWGDTATLNGVDIVYANTNGDGVIDVDDTLAISNNYNFLHQKGSGSNHGIPLFLYSPTTVSHVGDTINIDVILGLDTLLADSVYGIAFSITYDNTLVDSGSARFVLDSTWMGDPGVDLFSMQKDLFLDGQVDIGISRTDHQIRSGYGQIARLGIVIVVDIIDKRAIKDTLRFKIENVRLIAADGRVIPVEAGKGLEIPVDDVNSILPPLPEGSIHIYPNPTKNYLNIDIETTERVSIYVYTLQGKQVFLLEDVKGKKQVDLSSLSPGMYILQAKNSKGQLHKKIILSE